MNYHNACDVPFIDVIGSNGDFASTWDLIKQKLITPFVSLPVTTYYLGEKDQNVREKLPDDLSKTELGSVLNKSASTVAVAAINEDSDDVRSFAHFCFKLGLEHNVNVNLGVKDHILNMDDRNTTMIFHQVFYFNYFQAFHEANLSYRHWKRDDMLAYIQNNDHSKALWVSKNATCHPQADPRLSAINVKEHIGSVVNTWTSALMEASLLSNNLALCEFADHLARVYHETCGETFGYLFNGSIDFDNASEPILVRKIINVMAEKLGKICITLSMAATM